MSDNNPYYGPPSNGEPPPPQSWPTPSPQPDWSAPQPPQAPHWSPQPSQSDWSQQQQPQDWSNQPPQQDWSNQPPQQNWAAGQPGWQQPVAPPRRSAGKIIGIIAAVLVVLLIICCGGIYWLGKDTLDKQTKAYPSATHPSGVSATSTATGSPGGPFAGTPAADYPQGADGITLPAATAVSGWTQKQVTDGLVQVKAALVASRLDERMLNRRDPAALLSLMAKGIRDGIAKDFTTDQFSVYATQISPTRKLATEKPRVKGRITYRATSTTEGVHVLEIVTNFVWVYAFTGGGEDNLVVVHDEVTWQIPVSSEVKTEFRGLWLSKGTSYGSNVDCTEYRAGLLAPTPKSAKGTGNGGANDNPGSMFDPERSLNITTTC